MSTFIQPTLFRLPDPPSRYDPQSEAQFRNTLFQTLQTFQSAIKNAGTGGSGGAVSSVFTRTGAVVAQSGDYTAAQVTNAVSLAPTAVQVMQSSGATVTPLQIKIGTGAGSADLLDFLNTTNNVTLGITGVGCIYNTFATSYPILLLGPGGAAGYESSSVMVTRAPTGTFAWDMFRQDTVANTPSWMLFEAYSSGTTRALIGQIAANSIGMLLVGGTGYGVGITVNGSASASFSISSGGVSLFSGNFQTAASCYLSEYNGIATVGSGLTPTFGALDNTGLSAAQSSVSIMTTPSSGGMVVTTVHWVATITTAATTSCTLGGATGFQLTYTDFTSGNVTTINVATISGTATTNTAGASISGVATVIAKANTALQYSFGYTSSGGTAMVYRMDIRVSLQG